MAKRPRMQAKPSRLYMALPLTSFRQNRREENRGSGRSWKREDSEQWLKHPVISEFNAKDFGSSRAVPIFLL